MRIRSKTRRRRANPRRPAATRPKWRVVRGAKRNPVVMALESSEGQARRLAKWFQAHAGDKTVRVVKFRPAKEAGQ